MWVSIEDELPMMFADDFIQRGYRLVDCKCEDGTEVGSGVADHHTWYFMARRNGITH